MSQTTEASSVPHPGTLTVMMQLMKLRVIVLLQITALCAILSTTASHATGSWTLSERGTKRSGCPSSPSWVERSLQVGQTRSTCGTMQTLTPTCGGP